jgi:hypothetical protein
MSEEFTKQKMSLYRLCIFMVSRRILGLQAFNLRATNIFDRHIFSNCRPSSDRLCGLVLRDLGYITEMYCASCEVRTEFIYVM